MKYLRNMNKKFHHKNIIETIINVKVGRSYWQEWSTYFSWSDLCSL